MLRVITGRFHPSLETILVEQIRHAKADDPLAPLAILVPSAPLLARLRQVVAAELQQFFLGSQG